MIFAEVIYRSFILRNKIRNDIDNFNQIRYFKLLLQDNLTKFLENIFSDYAKFAQPMLLHNTMERILHG